MFSSFVISTSLIFVGVLKQRSLNAGSRTGGSPRNHFTGQWEIRQSDNFFQIEIWSKCEERWYQDSMRGSICERSRQRARNFIYRLSSALWMSCWGSWLKAFTSITLRKSILIKKTFGSGMLTYTGSLLKKNERTLEPFFYVTMVFKFKNKAL